MAGFRTVRAGYEEPLWLLLAIAGLVLLTACANVASLSLVRAAAREPELALRLALGATRSRVVRQLLVEGALIAVIGTVAGLALARVAANAAIAVLSTRTDPIVLDVGIDWRILTFSALAVCLTTIAFALAPALRATRGTQATLAAGRATWARERVTMREMLVAAQVALSVVLVSAAALFLLTFRNLSTADAGFNAPGVLFAHTFLVDEQHPAAARGALARELTARFAAIPGVTRVAFASTPPLGGSVWGTVVRVTGPQGEIKESNRNQISAEYFEALQIPILAGRGFGEQDSVTSPKVAVVNETFARRFFDGRSPLGQRFADGDQTFEIVGLVGDTKQYGLREDFRAIAYTSASQVGDPGPTIRFVLRLQLDTAATIPAVRQALADVSPTAAVRFATLAGAARESLAREQLLAGLSGFFGAIAAVLAIVGVYGVVSYTAASRKREIGIRLALGARASDVLRAVVGRVAVVAAAGLAVGLLVSRSAGAAASSFLYGIEPNDPIVTGAILTAISLSALLAAIVPARRALRIDPVSALKDS
jgi:putative ABC transport system permease protein